MSTSTPLTLENVKPSMGCPLQIQAVTSGGETQRLSARLVGYIQGKSVLITTPHAQGKPVRLRAGQKIVVSMMVANGICVFSSSVEFQVSEPYPLVYVGYPTGVNFKGIRGATRVNVLLPVEAKNLSSLNEVTVGGVVGDISISGARLELPQVIGEVGDRIRLIGGIGVNGIQRNLSIDGVIRSRVERSTREREENLPVIYGVEFTEADDDRLLILYAYVFSQMADSHAFSSDT